MDRFGNSSEVRMTGFCMNNTSPKRKRVNSRTHSLDSASGFIGCQPEKKAASLKARGCAVGQVFNLPSKCLTNQTTPVRRLSFHR